MKSSKPITTPKPYESPSTFSAWNIKSQSPPPICSSTSSGTPSSVGSSSHSPMTHNLFSQFPAESSSSPTIQRSFAAWNSKKDSRVEVDNYTPLAYHLGNLSISNMQHSYSHGVGMNSNFPEQYSGKPIISHRIFDVSDGGIPESLQLDLMTRPKPYSAFLDDVKKRGFEAEIEAWKRAKEEAILERFKRKEAVIGEWEVRHTSKAMEEMKKTERKLEKMRAKAVEKLQKRISITRAEANKKARKARHETMEKMTQISKLSIKARATNNLSCLKL